MGSIRGKLSDLPMSATYSVKGRLASVWHYNLASVFGGWLRNVDDENMAPTWEYNKKLAQRSEQIGCDPDRLAKTRVQWIL